MSGRCVRRLSQTKSCWIDVAPAPFGFIVYDSSAYCFSLAGGAFACSFVASLAWPTIVACVLLAIDAVHGHAIRLVGNVCFV